MSTAAINSASAHRQISKKLEGKKGVSRTQNANGPHGTTVMSSLINDESILSHHGNMVEHNSLIVDSANHRLNADVNILS